MPPGPPEQRIGPSVYAGAWDTISSAIFASISSKSRTLTELCRLHSGLRVVYLLSSLLAFFGRKLMVSGASSGKRTQENPPTHIPSSQRIHTVNNDTQAHT